MSVRSLIVHAGGQVFCTHPLSGVVQVGSLDHASRSFHGRGGDTPPRISPNVRPPVAVERYAPRPPAAAPVSTSTPTLGSHLWVG
jgi:hypothetical protein